ncbi:MAG: 3-hydroxyacyl-CoA dehydrogenase NAD-binding domain-containing protein [Rhodopseudomonas palustris]|nr:3-hydroxyacyl-CoA dehydrogenase NAD-binding domain-containing protein [Rhodopseudomonas palustris]
MVGVVGAGAMGAGIAQVAARRRAPGAGCSTRALDAAGARATAASTATSTALRRQGQARRGRARRPTLARVQPAATLAELRRLRAGRSRRSSRTSTAKRDAVRRSSRASSAPDCVLATNTSSLSITAIAAALQHPARLAGMHFFNPAPLMTLVEIVSGAGDRSPRWRDAARATARGLGQDAGARRSRRRASSSTACARPFYAEALRAAAASAPPTRPRSTR